MITKLLGAYIEMTSRSSKIIFYLLTLLMLHHNESSFGQSKIKLLNRNGVYYVPCKVNGVSMNFIFDTGASIVSLTSIEAEYMFKNGFLSESDIIGSGKYKIANGSVIDAKKVLLKKIKIGDYELENIEAIIIKNQSASLLLGQSLLQKLGEFTFNYEENTLLIGKKDDSRKNIKSIKEIHPKSVSDAEYRKQLFEIDMKLYSSQKNRDTSSILPLYVSRWHLNSKYKCYKEAYTDHENYIRFANNDLHDLLYALESQISLSIDHAYYSTAIKDVSKEIELLKNEDINYFYVLIESYDTRSYIYSNYMHEYFKSVIELSTIITLIESNLELTNEYDYLRIYYMTKDRWLAQFLSKRSEAKYKLKDYMGAIADLNRAIWLYTSKVNSNLVKPSRPVDLSSYNSALVDEIENLAKYYELRAVSNFILARNASSLHDLDSAIALKSDNPYCYWMRGHVKLEMNMRESACLDFSKAGEGGFEDAYDIIKKYCN